MPQYGEQNEESKSRPTDEAIEDSKRKELGGKSVKELREMCNDKFRDLDFSACIEKCDLVEFIISNDNTAMQVQLKTSGVVDTLQKP